MSLLEVVIATVLLVALVEYMPRFANFLSTVVLIGLLLMAGLIAFASVSNIDLGFIASQRFGYL